MFPGVELADGIFPGWSAIFWFSGHCPIAKVRGLLLIEH